MMTQPNLHNIVIVNIFYKISVQRAEYNPWWVAMAAGISPNPTY